MRQVVDGVFEIDLGRVNAHVIVVDDGVVLVDSGLPGNTPAVEQALAEIPTKIGKVHTILLTHYHPDHIGSVAELRRRSGARVVAHEADAPIITGAQPMVATGLLRVVALFTRSPEAVPIDETLHRDGPISVSGISVVHTPGHTPGHVSFLLDRAGGLLFVGDAAVRSRRGNVRPAPRFVTDNAEAAATSLARLAQLDFATAVFGHGKALTGGAVDHFKALAG